MNMSALTRGRCTEHSAESRISNPESRSAKVHRRATIAVAAFALLQGSVAWTHGQGACETTAKQPAISAARAALERSPQTLAPRLTLSDLLVESGCYEDAIHVLEEADKVHPRNA